MILESWLDDRNIPGRPSVVERQRALALDVHELMPLFAYGHLPPALQAVSEPFGVLAAKLLADAPVPTLQLVQALTHLLQAKDAAVRAVLVKPKVGG